MKKKDGYEGQKRGDIYAYKCVGGLGDKTEISSARKVEWMGQYNGSSNEFVYPSLSKAGLINQNRLARMKLGLEAPEPESRALDKGLKLGIEDFLPPLEKAEDITDRTSKPSGELIDRLAEMGVEFSEAELSGASPFDASDSNMNRPASSSSSGSGARSRTMSALANEPEPLPLYEDAKASLTWDMKDLHGKPLKVDPKVEKFNKDINVGEIFLRRQLKTSYEQNLVKKKEEARKTKVERKSRRRTSSVQIDITQFTDGRRDSSAIFQKDTRSDVDIYTGLVLKFKNEMKVREFGINQEEDIHDEDIFLTEVSILDKHLNNLAANNAKLAGDVKMAGANEHLHAGLTYYRIHNSVHHIEEEKERSEMEKKQSRILTQKGETRRPTIRITDAMKRQQKRIQNASMQVPALKTGEQEYYSAERLAYHSAQPAELQRIRRVMGARYIGYDVPEVLQDAGFNVNGNNKSSSIARVKSEVDSEVDSEEDEDDFGSESSVDSRDIPHIDRQHMKRELTQDAKNAHAKDVLLATQLKEGILPENVFRRRPGYEETVSLDLSHYGLGDKMGACLGTALTNYEGLDALVLKSNRLWKSIPIIVDNMARNLVQLDLSQNNLHGSGFQALTRFFKDSQGNSMVILDVSSSKLDSSDTINFFNVLRSNVQQGIPVKLRELNIAHNHIRADACTAMKDFLLCSGCKIMALEMGWNSLSADGAETLGEMLKTNTSLHELDLRANNIGDLGAQKIAASLAYNKTIKEINLAQNSISGRACFVFSKVLSEHPKMTKLDLTANPLGDAGARSLFRTILRGLRCFVIMRDCVFPVDHKSFDHANPSAQSPYALDMSVPYQAAILNELCIMVALQEDDCSFDGGISVADKVTGKMTTQAVIPSEDKKLVDKKSGAKWKTPLEGIVHVNIIHRVKMPSMGSIISDHGLMVLLLIVIHARTESDRSNWLKLLTMDAWFSCKQVQHMLDRLSEERLLGAGSLTMQSVLLAVWTRIVDAENKFDFLCDNLNPEGRHILANNCSFEMFRFSWLNPSGRWRLDLSRHIHRNLFIQLIAVNNWQSSRSRDNGRDDTSQMGNWNNFRNETYRGERIVLDKEWMASIPQHGTVEFDFVSTERPSTLSGSRPGTANSNSRPGTGTGGSRPGTADSGTQSQTETERFESITEPEMVDLKSKLGLSDRRRIPKSRSIIAAMELHVAAVKYFFRTEDVLSIMDCFSEDVTTQTKVVTSLFCRILDLENFHIVMRHLSTAAATQVAEALGWLNILNPMHPANDYRLRLQYYDERYVAVYMLQLGASEGDPIRDNTKSEVNLIEAYSSLGRLKDDSHPRQLLFSYKDIGEAKSPPIWNLRRDLIRHFLIGTDPISRDVYRPIKMYKELKDAGALKVGPLDLQYREFTKEKLRRERKLKAKMMIKGNLMLNKLKAAKQ